jgi:Amino acid permease
VTYALVAFAAVAFAGTAEEGIGLANPENADDVFVVLGTAIFGDNALGRLLEGLLVFSVLTSAAASTQTTVLPTARSALSMGSHQALPHRFTRIHPRFLTPSYATWAVGAVAVGYYAFLTAVSSDVLSDSIAALGMMIAAYYSLTGFACVWYYRRRLHGRDLWTKGVLPGLGAVLLLLAFVLSAVDYAVPTEDGTSVFGLGGTFVAGVGTLLLGAVIMLVYSRLAPEFFRGTTLPRGVAGGGTAGHGEPTAFDDDRMPDAKPASDTDPVFGASPPSSGRLVTGGDPVTEAHPLTAQDPAADATPRTEPVSVQEPPRIVLPPRRRAGDRPATEQPDEGLFDPTT